MKDEFVKCTLCDKMVCKGYAIEYEDESYCYDCYNDIFTECLSCKEAIERNDAEQYDNEDYCKSCFEETFNECYGCGKITDKEDLHRGSDDNWYCESCWDNKFFECENCNDVGLESQVCIGSDDRSYCESCFDDIFSYCGECDETLNREDLYYSDEDDCYYCENCHNNIESCTRGRHDYGYRPISLYHGIMNSTTGLLNSSSDTTDNPYLFLGVELETEYDGVFSLDELCPELLDKFSDNERLFYLKYDSSISHGFELVTHPMTLEYHKNKFDWDGVLQWLRKNHFISHNTSTCGLHIHASKQFLSEREQRRLGVFISLNQLQTEAVARRKDNGYGRYKKIQKEGKTVYRLEDANKNENGRDSAVNWSNIHTYEFRLFKGSLIHNTIIASLEFVESLSKFVKTVSIRKIVDNESWLRYIEFLTGFNGDYGMLMKYMEHVQTKKRNIGVELVKMQTELIL